MPSGVVTRVARIKRDFMKCVEISRRSCRSLGFHSNIRGIEKEAMGNFLKIHFQRDQSPRIQG